MRKYSDITGRIEAVRTQLGLNKARFSGKMGIKPQTYNNFIGKQGSKPNMELFDGIVRVFGVNPMWLLSGAGEPFASHGAGGNLPSWPGGNGNGDGEPASQTPSGADPEADNGKIVPLRGPARYPKGTVSELKEQLGRVLQPVRECRTPLLCSQAFQDPQVQYAADVILHRFWSQPAETAAVVIGLLEQFSANCEDLEWIESQQRGFGK